MKHVAVIGAGPAGLMAADVLSAEGVAVTVHDRMPSPGRKFLLAGRGGLNLTHSEPRDQFVTRYCGSVHVADAVDAFAPEDLRRLADALGEDTFVGSSGRVFPRNFKASPLLRAWLRRLRTQGVELRVRETLVGFDDAQPVVASADGSRHMLTVDATILALGGGSWPRLGSDGAWVDFLRARDVAVAPLQPANCGLLVRWSRETGERFAGRPVKRAGFSFAGRGAPGEAVITRTGLEGGAIYALASAVRDALGRGESAHLCIDLVPHLTTDEIAERIAGGRAGDSRANALRKRLSLSPAALALLREDAGGPLPREPGALAARVKDVRIAVAGVAGIARAISSAGGVHADALDGSFMVRALPGVFVAGEMLDWDAPTGGYLLQACFATGAAAARGVLSWLDTSSLPAS